MLEAKQYEVTATFKVLLTDLMNAADLESELDDLSLPIENGLVTEINVNYKVKNVTLDVVSTTES
jgi:hypothetical protein